MKDCDGACCCPDCQTRKAREGRPRNIREIEHGDSFYRRSVFGFMRSARTRRFDQPSSHNVHVDGCA